MLAKVHLSSGHAEWLETERAISAEVASRLGIVSNGANLAFQFRKSGVVLYTKTRIERQESDGSLGKTFRAEPSGVTPILWNYDCLNETPADIPMIITEGELDAASFETCGMSAVSVPNGAQFERPSEGDISIKDDQAFRYLWDQASAGLDAGLRRFRKIILAVDADKKGRVLGLELATRLDRRRCWYVTYPGQVIPELGRPVKDGNEVLKYLGQNALADLIGDAKPIAPATLVTYGSLPVDTRPALSTGLGGLDQHLRVRTKTLWIATGIPNHGKTQLVTGIFALQAWLHGQKGALLQLEDNVEKNREDLIAFYKVKRGTQSIGDPKPDDFHRALETITDEEALAWVDRMFVTVALDESDADLDPYSDLSSEQTKPRDLVWLKEVIQEAAVRHGCKWIVIDPWNEIEHLFNTKAENELQYLGRALRELKALTRRFDITICIVAHTDKSAMFKTEIEELSLADVSGGGIWNARADVGLIVFMPDRDSPTRLVNVCKTKDWKRMGKPGIVQLRYRSAFATWEFEQAYFGKHGGRQ